MNYPVVYIASSKYLLDIPNELKIAIAEYLDDKDDVCNLRLAHSLLRDAADTRFNVVFFIRVVVSGERLQKRLDILALPRLLKVESFTITMRMPDFDSPTVPDTIE